MGTVFEILAPSFLRPRIEIAHAALDEITRLEGLMSYFSGSSRVSEINRDAYDREVPVENDLFEVLTLGRRVWEQTGGAFDFAAGALWRCWGFHCKSGRIPQAAELEAARACSGAGQVALSGDPPGVRFLRRGLEVNLGSIGKGFALDHAGRILQNADFGPALLHAGHSSFLALGNPVPGLPGWRVSVRRPTGGEGDLLWIQLASGGMATSGGGEQYFEVDGKKYPHILDPRTGIPADRNLGVTVLASTAALADALSTALFVMDRAEIEAFCADHPEYGAIVIPNSPERREIETLKFGSAATWVVREFPDSREVGS